MVTAAKIVIRCLAAVEIDDADGGVAKLIKQFRREPK